MSAFPSATAHSLKVQHVQEQVRHFYRTKQKIRIYHGGTNSTRVMKVNRQYAVDTSQFTDILEVNLAAGYVVVEPNVSFGKLVDALLGYGLMPAVVSEFPEITIGGAVQGGAGESSSFNQGCLHASVLTYEIVLGNGKILLADSSHHSDLFYGIPCSYGTLGVLTSVKLAVVPVTNAVQLTYIRVSSPTEAVECMKSEIQKTPRFVDAIMFSPQHGVVMIGGPAETNAPITARFHRARDEWFYLHARAIADTYGSFSDVVPIRDYLFRYNRGAFWVGRYGFKIFKMPFTHFTRAWFASLMQTKTLYRFLHGANLAGQYIIQDICLPEQNVTQFVDFLDENFDIYPLWLCPLAPDTKVMLAPNYIDTDLVINVGVWGEHRRPYQEFTRDNQKLETTVSQLGGRKVLYANTYYDHRKFWSLYNQPEYDKLRRKYHATTIFKDIHDKVSAKAPAKASLLKGWLAFLKSPY